MEEAFDTSEDSAEAAAKAKAVAGALKAAGARDILEIPISKIVE